jgi:poly(3-hydroxybutyrate) depolymerase
MDEFPRGTVRDAMPKRLGRALRLPRKTFSTRWRVYRTSVFRIIPLVALLSIAAPLPLPGQRPSLPEPLRRTLTFGGVQREYFLYLPEPFDNSKTYWPLVVVHGGDQDGRTPFPNASLARFVAESRLEAIVVSPSFSNDDYNASRFPSLGEGAFLDEVLTDVRRSYSLRPKMLLAGYSRGGQFSHRYAFAHPERVAAVAPLASGTWTTPDGRFLVEGVGEIRNATAYLTDSMNASKVPERFRDLFQPRVAAVSEASAVEGARSIPFLVMCGTLDPRLPIAQEFARSLESLGYQVSVEWPRTPHGCDDMACWMERRVEWEKYLLRTVAFFARVAKGPA